jgi:hypothetical protein
MNGVLEKLSGKSDRIGLKTNGRYQIMQAL